MGTFEQSHADYLDPDKHGVNDEIGPDNILAVLKGYDTGRMDGVDCCLTGKDADLEPHGEQGIRIEGCDYKDTIFCKVELGKTFAGSDVCLNLPSGLSNEEYDKLLGLYLEQATEVICDCNVPGEWSGDDWYMSWDAGFSVELIVNDDLEEDADATAKAIIDKANELLEPVEEELKIADDILDILCGWVDLDGNRCEEGKPGGGSVWHLYRGMSK